MKEITKLNIVRRTSQITYLSGGVYLSSLVTEQIQIIYLLLLVIAAITYGFSLSQTVEYLEKAKRPTALRALITQQLGDMDIAPFAQQVLTAKSWYHGNNAKAMEAIMKEMIDQANSGLVEINDAILQAARKVQQTINEE